MQICLNHDSLSFGAGAQGAVDSYKRPAEVHGLPKSITLYQYEVCPFCCKVKAALDYYKVRHVGAAALFAVLRAAHVYVSTRSGT